MTTRSGSAFLLCLALAAFAAMVGYAFLRGAARQEMSGKSEMLRALARDAASSGLAHAFEQILIDYNAPSLAVATATGPVNIASAPTFLDGPYRAPFVSTSAPNRIAYIKSSKDDVMPRNHVMSVLMQQGELSFHWWHDTQDGDLNRHSGCTIYDSRGRYVEVNYHNVTRPSPVDANPVPVVATSFTDPNAAVPERSDGLFMDENLHRLVGGTPEEQRRKARYRLRYAVGVEDLAGHLLTNPRPRMNIDWKDADNDYRAIPRWVDHAANALDNMVSSWNTNRRTALRLGHIFRGRGNANNADRAWSVGPRHGLPATFPMMFRTTDLPWHGLYLYSTAQPNLGGRLFSYAGTTGFEAISANPNGGEILTPMKIWSPNVAPEELPYAHALVGPQHSWFSQIFSIQGCSMPSTTIWERDSEVHRSFLSTIYTPYGRSQRASSAPSENWKWYEGRVDTPWHVNLLTAPPEVISEMIIGYAPPYLKTLKHTHDAYYKKIGETVIDKNIVEIFDANETISKRNTNGGKGWDTVVPGLDILNDQLSGGFSEFPAPSSLHTDGTTAIKPDYYQNPPDPRPFVQCYPGPLARGDSTQLDQGSDDMGKDIDVDVAMGEGMQVGWCTHTYNPLLFFGGSDRIRFEDDGPPTNQRWKVIRRVDPLLNTYKYSYFWDMFYALTTTLSYARAVWVQYPNGSFDPRPGSANTGFLDPALRDPLAYDTIEEIDALFLRQMGENIAAPGSPCPDNPIVSGRWPITKSIRFQVCTKPVSNTISSLVTKDLLKTAGGVSSVERAKVMERILNDFRMSFFGASTEYVDFRPLDFDGDGHVNCSCYDANPLASMAEKKYRTNRWKPAEANGKGPSPSTLTSSFDAALMNPPYSYPQADPTLGTSPWFSATGCFYIGKSHYYRIFTRGEVYDNLLMKPVAQQTLETVLTVDPEAPRFPPAGRISTEQRVLFTQWHYNRSIIDMPLQMR